MLAAARPRLLAVVLAFGLTAASAGATRHVFLGLERRGVAGVALSAPSRVAVSPDGAHAYVAAADGTSVFARDAGGVLAVVEVKSDVLRSIAISPDGAYVYGPAGAFTTVFSIFDRNPVSGALTFDSFAGTASGGTMVPSPDGEHAYLFAGTGAAGVVEVLDRNPVTGALASVEVHQDGVGGVDRIAVPRALALSPDGAHVYVSSFLDDAVTVFARDAGTGALTLVEAVVNGQGGVTGLDNGVGVVVSPDGLHVYAAGQASDAVARFDRDGGTGSLAFAGSTPAHGPVALAISPDGEHVYVTASDPDALRVFDRNPATGVLTPADVLEDDVAGTDGLAQGRGITVAADGVSLYVAAHDEDEVSVFRPATVDCTPAPAVGCRTPAVSGAAKLIVKDNPTLDRGDKLVWTWARGSATSVADFGDPVAVANDYVLCVYDGSAAPQPLVATLLQAGAGCGKPQDPPTRSCWRPLPGKGFKYRNEGRPDGVAAAKLLAGAEARAKIKVKAKGETLDTPSLPLAPPVVVQLQSAAGPCWEATYSTPSINFSAQFKAKAD
jgi:DNA-binding beta-propeller fold protein YncE